MVADAVKVMPVEVVPVSEGVADEDPEIEYFALLDAVRVKITSGLTLVDTDMVSEDEGEDEMVTAAEKD